MSLGAAEGAMIRLAHVVNPVDMPPSSDLRRAQPITFESMRVARELARPVADVALVATRFPEDRGVETRGFLETPELTRSVLDVARFREARKLPLVRDILDRAHEVAPEADYLVYTNVDIALMPHFYVTVAGLLAVGHDAVIINRRTIPGHYEGPDQLPLMWAELGKAHPGHDCFVFRRDRLPDFELGSACVGMLWIGKILGLNVAARADRCLLLEKSHLTFHVGEEEPTKDERFSDFHEHNLNETRQALHALETRFGSIDARPCVDVFTRRLFATHTPPPAHVRVVRRLGGIVGPWVAPWIRGARVRSPRFDRFLRRTRPGQGS
jgi:hypothetical protein